MPTGHSELPAPIRFAANRPDARPYRGGLGISRLRGIPDSDAHPEDFVASTTEVANGGGVGLSRLPDGTLLRDAVTRDPLFYLGAAHVERFGASPELLVKLLDTGERLFVHFHPDDAFAADHLGAPHGKTEAWIVTDVRGIGGAAPDGFAYLGWNRQVRADEVDAWVSTQDIDGMLAAMVRVRVEPGTVLFVPGGVPHSIGPGITLVELQQPSDLSVLLEYAGYPIDPADAFLGMDRGLALSALDRRAVPATASPASLAPTPISNGRSSLFQAEADPFFRAERIAALPEGVTLDPGFAVLVILDGTGVLAWADGSIPVARGETLLIPHVLGETALSGVTAIRCRPPAA